MNSYNLKVNSSTREQISSHLKQCDNLFVPNLSSYVDIDSYSQKLYDKSQRFEVYCDDNLIGLICAYINDSDSFITNVSIIGEYQGKGLSNFLLDSYIEHSKSKKHEKIKLEVKIENQRAISFYKKKDFNIIKKNNDNLTMELDLKRDYNKEFKDTADHKYAYNFDFDVMHHYMMKSFETFFKKTDVLELGSFKGDFTKRLLPYFSDITCIEASSEAVSIAKSTLDTDKITFITGLFEDVELPKKYNNIILTHVLEHIDNPVELLKKINDNWLSDDGQLFIVCPNANAPSRQIAVKMGLISHNTAITPSEKEHGHRITYTLDTLERDAKKAGLNIQYRSGIFFKALANFQWDALLNTDIISKKYLDGCYELGQIYPDLCSSILIICRKGTSN